MTTEMVIAHKRNRKPQEHFQGRLNEIVKNLNAVQAAYNELAEEARCHGYNVDMNLGVVIPAKVTKQ